jgi:hypothetical protein
MRVKVQRVGPGLHHSEVVVAIKTTTGPARLVVDNRSIEREMLEIGYPIDRDGDKYLIELPRETTTGSWRVWVAEDMVVDSEMAPAE